MKALFKPFIYIGRLLSSDPAASCSRALAIGVIMYVGIMGMQHWDTLTQVQVTFLMGFLSGLLPYVTGKLFENVPSIISSLKGKDELPK